MELENLARIMGEQCAADGPGGSKIPKYVVLSDQIVANIEAGNLKSGERLPGEADLAAVLPVSLGTIQKALSRLVDQGMVVRRHGTGTFVADGRQRLTDLRHFRFLADDDETLLPVFATVKAISVISHDGPWVRFLGVEGSHICIERKINVNGEFDCFARFYVADERFPALAKTDRHRLDNVSFRTFLKDNYGVATMRVAELVAAETMPDDICEVMGLAVKTTGLVYHLRGFGYRDGPVSYQIVYIPPASRRLEFGPNWK